MISKWFLSSPVLLVWGSGGWPEMFPSYGDTECRVHAPRAQKRAETGPAPPVQLSPAFLSGSRSGSGAGRGWADRTCVAARKSAPKMIKTTESGRRCKREGRVPATTLNVCRDPTTAAMNHNHQFLIIVVGGGTEMSPLHNHVLTLPVKSVFWYSKYNDTHTICCFIWVVILV